jgi:hypothetical protein
VLCTLERDLIAGVNAQERSVLGLAALPDPAGSGRS